MAWFALPFCSALLAFGHARVRALLPGLSRDVEATPPGWRLVAAHLAVFALFLAVCSLVPPPGPRSAFLVGLLYLSALSSIALAVVAFVPARAIVALARAAGDAWIYASIAAAVTGGLILALVAYWNGVESNPLEILTFRCVKASLSLFVPDVQFDGATRWLGTSRFRVRVGGGCSGAEGLGLMLVFSTAWLWFFRKENRFPRALLLVPAALAATWVANVGRITALLLIGHAGAGAVAKGGFHSQAGWILFNAIALGFAAVAGRLAWFGRDVDGPRAEPAAENRTAVYLAPFLAILAASFVSKASSAGFEWLYPLRFASAVAGLWFYRSAYRRLDWRFGWPAVGTGAALFALWIAMDSLEGPQADTRLGAGLAALPVAARTAWVVVRASAAVITVPIAEELAFRGYLLRRLIASDFESVSFRALTASPILVSSLCFGALHGGEWLAGTLAGVAFAFVFRRRGGIGDAVAAHATTNALLAAWVIGRGDWHLW